MREGGVDSGGGAVCGWREDVSDVRRSGVIKQRVSSHGLFGSCADTERIGA